MPDWTALRARMAGYAANFRRNSVAHRHDLAILGIILVAVVVFLIPYIVYTVPAGDAGVLWYRFGGGTVTDRFLGEGTHFIWPWDRLFIYDLKLQMGEEEFDVRSVDDLSFRIDVVWRYRLFPDSIGLLHKYVGVDYDKTLIAPTVAARTRDIVAQYEPDQILTKERLTIQKQLAEAVRHVLLVGFDPDGGTDDDVTWCVLEDVLIKGISLPPSVQKAIMDKEVSRQQAEQYDYIVDKERKEAGRKRVEATGIRNFQEIVSNGMSESYLKWRGIEATLDLARSPNSKIVVIGNTKDGLPLIFNGDSSSDLEAGHAASTAAPLSLSDHSETAPGTDDKGSANASPGRLPTLPMLPSFLGGTHGH